MTIAANMEIYKTFVIESAHRLPNLPENHKCSRLHGHSFVIEVHVSGSNDNTNGWVMDFSDIGKKFQPIFKRLDHHYLNEISGLENPTSENLAKWIWHELQPNLPLLYSVVVKETCTTGCIYKGE